MLRPAVLFALDAADEKWPQWPRWSLKDFAPMDFIPNTVCLTNYRTDSDNFAETPIDEMAAQISRGELRVQVGRSFRLDEIAEAHRCVEENSAGGKIVVLT